MKLLNKYLLRRYRWQRLVFLVASIAFGFFITYMISTFSPGKLRIEPDYIKTLNASKRRLLESDESESYIPGWDKAADATYPKEIFHIDHLRKGAVILHVIGLIYMFIALAIVCDEFFVPALEVIIEVLNISEDVAGATFMAAGGSAPELFTSLVGVFIAKSDVGIGTIVGSAVFNILFVIGMCSFFSKGVLTLTWWPLFRDVNFYLISLACLIVFFIDEQIKYYEAIILFACYICYVVFMKFNATIEQKFKMCLHRRCGAKKPGSIDDPASAASTAVVSKKKSQNSVGAPFVRNARKSLVQLMAHLNEEPVPGIPQSSIKQQQSGVSSQSSMKQGNQPQGNQSPVQGSSPTKVQSPTAVNKQHSSVVQKESTDFASAISTTQQSKAQEVSFKENVEESNEPEEMLEEEEQVPMDMSWPEGTVNRINYLFLFPICALLWVTVPDVRSEAKRKFFPITFIMSIVWIGGYSYLMVWWATTIGATVDVDTTIMGLTFLAAGTSIPDLITSVIVAKKGFGDMAVSSSIGSNIFDITVGLPVPWMLYVAIFGKSYAVSAKGIACSVILLMMMLVAVVLCVALSGWKMKKILGVAMMFLYAVFLTIAIMISFKPELCPDIRM